MVVCSADKIVIGLFEFNDRSMGQLNEQARYVVVSRIGSADREPPFQVAETPFDG